MTPATNRRWFRFSLRGLFVTVTVVGVCLAWQTSIVATRKAFLRTRVVRYNGDLMLGNPGKPGASIPFYRRWLGDTLVEHMRLRSLDDVDEANALFPEAAIHFWADNNGLVE